MKKSIIIILLSSMCLPSYGRTPKEYFEAENGILGLEYEWHELYPDYDEYSPMMDSCCEEIRKYVYAEVLSTLDDNSIAYADTLLRLNQFLKNHPEEVRANAQKIKAIVLPKEGKSKRYYVALKYELNSWPVDVYPHAYEIPYQRYADDTMAIITSLLEDLLTCSHTYYRPTDKDYIDLIGSVAKHSFRTLENEAIVKEEDGDADIYCEKFDYHWANVLWSDLLKWDSISAEEYALLCNGEYMSDMAYTYQNLRYSGNEDTEFAEREECYFCKDNRYRSVLVWNRRFFPEEYVRICHAHEQITKRIYGMNSEEYIGAAEYYLEALRATCRSDEAGAEITKQNMIRAKALCEDMLKYSPLHKGSPVYYEWILNLYSCRLSLEGASKKLQKEIDNTAKEVEATKNTGLQDLFLDLRTECALLMQNYDYAIQIQNEALRKMPAIPQPKDQYDYDGIEAYYHEASKQLKPHINVLHTYVLSGDFENANTVLAYLRDIISDGGWGMPDDDVSIGESMHNGLFNFDWYNIYPHRMKLYKRYNQAIFEHYGYKDERDVY